MWMEGGRIGLQLVQCALEGGEESVGGEQGEGVSYFVHYQISIFQFLVATLYLSNIEYFSTMRVSPMINIKCNFWHNTLIIFAVDIAEFTTKICLFN